VTKLEIIEKLLSGNIACAAKFITKIENRDNSVADTLKEIFPYTGKAHIIGVTGSPGVGKSSLVYEIIKNFRRAGKDVGIIAVDPTSPFTGGAVLGDRLRMEKNDFDPKIFIRSMATRGKLGGLSAATWDAVNVMDAMGKDVVIVETVGVGQNEVDILEIAHTTLLLLAPGLGDEIQAIKSGIVEIGDIFVVNKCDREGAENTVQDIQHMLSLSPMKSGWIPGVLKTSVLTGEGIEALMESIERHKQYLERENIFGGNKYTEGQFLALIKELLTERLISNGGKGEIKELVEKIRKREIDPYTAADLLLSKRKWEKKS
jgi:LAO/AO transport system kinase